MTEPNKLVKIEAEVLRELSGNRKDVMDMYFYKYPIMSDIYWARLAKMLRMAQKFDGKKVLDLGCGQGVFLPSLSKHYEEVHGVDLDLSICSRIKETLKLDNVTLHNENILESSLEGAEFDLILAPSVLEHFSDQDALFKSLTNMLKPGGHLIFSSPTETRLYELGRKIFGAVKPEDHYHSVFAIQRYAKKYLNFVTRETGPFSLLPSLLSVYVICAFQKPKEQ
ncbi:MAG: class I SAM-dependent methyltransferase [Flavobacteriales bacterium]|nr:class I SAM-dependent methyltransferase [Flavobacteriales bacterium]